MANTQNSVQPAAPVSNQATSYSRNKQMAAPIWSALFKGHQNFATKRRPLGLLDLPAEIIDMILGYTCSGWAVTIRQIPYTFSRPQSYIFIEPHAQSAKIGPALMSLASTNSLLREHLRRCLYSPALFSGYTQLIGLDHQSLASPRMQEFVLAASISTLWPRVTPEMFLNWALSATTVLEIDSEIWETQYRFADVWHVCRKLRKLILVDSLDTVFSTSTVKESRDFFVRKVTDVGRFSSRWSRGMKELAARGIRVTLRTSRVHPSRIRGWTLSQQYPKDFHPMVLSLDIKPIPLPSHPDNIHIRPGHRDFRSPCCPTGRLHDPTLQYMYADLKAAEIEFKAVSNESTQPCDICRRWRLIWAGVNGDRKRYDEIGNKESTPGAAPES